MSTELQLVNHLLRTVGNESTSTLETQHPDVVQARLALDGYNRDFQSAGWWFNRNYGVKWQPEVSGIIRIADNVMEFTLARPESSLLNSDEKQRYVKRDSRVFDNLRNTNVIGHSILVDVLLLLPIEDLPAAAATYLKHWAGFSYYVDDDGDMTKANKLQERAEDAWANLTNASLRHQQPNALQTPYANKMRYRIGQFGSPSNPMLPGGRYR